MQIARSFQDPAYATRQSAFLGSVAAGSGGVTTKFCAHAALLLFSLNLQQITTGTSTYTNTVTGTGTATISGQQISLIIIQNTAASGAQVSLSTTTIGPFLAGGTFGTATGTGAVGAYNQYALNTAAAPANLGGIPIPQGALFFCVSGTDATAVTNCTVDYQINTGAGLTA
jgi:hypothetical protein